LKTLTHWEAALARAESARSAAHRNVRSYQHFVHAPKRWSKLPHRWWWGLSRAKYKHARNRWKKHRTLAALALREFHKAEKRVCYIQDRIEALSKQTAWTRVLRQPVV
jgi:hypothetical protein